MHPFPLELQPVRITRKMTRKSMFQSSMWGFLVVGFRRCRQKADAFRHFGCSDILDGIFGYKPITVYLPFPVANPASRWIHQGGSVPVGARLLAQERGNVITEENGSGWRRLLRVTWAIKSPVTEFLSGFLGWTKLTDQKILWTFTLFFFINIMGFNECESTKVQMTLDAFGGD